MYEIHITCIDGNFTYILNISRKLHIKQHHQTKSKILNQSFED